MELAYGEKEYNVDFIRLLQKYKEDRVYMHIPELPINTVFIKNSYYDTISFRTMICEIIYQAIQMFPLIKEYTILCENSKGRSKIIIGYHEEIDNDGELGLVKVQNKHGTFMLDKIDVHNLYIFNRCNECDTEIANALMLCLYLDGEKPSVKTQITCLSGHKGKEKY